MLLKPTDTEQKDIFELLHRRRKKSSTIFCSQYVFKEWYDQFGGQLVQLDYYCYIKFFGVFTGTWVGAFTKNISCDIIIYRNETIALYCTDIEI